MRCEPILSVTKSFPWQVFAEDPQYRKKIALRSSQGDVFTWQEIGQKINQTAVFLQTRGITSESTLAFCGKNSEAILFLYLASIQIGTKILGLNPAFPPEKIHALCAEYAIDRCFVDEDLLAIPASASSTLLSYHTADFFRPATMTLTSGSSGLPKAVVHHIKAHLDNARGVCQFMHFNASQSWLLSLPLYHVSGQGIVWRWLLCGAQLHFPQADFFASLLQATHASLVPTQLQRLLDYLRTAPQTRVNTKHILLGGAHIPQALTQEICQYGITAYSGYGMTEMASTIFAKPSDNAPGVGQPLLGREFKLMNEEIWLKGAGLALGYWKNGEIISLTNEQGWLQTKDKGIWKNNELVIIGRLDNMFISGGENIQPEEIERVILQSHLAKQVVVLPKADLEFGARPVALVEFYEHFTESAVEKLRVFLQTHLAKFKQPIAYYPLPCGIQQGAIKISRQALAQWLASQEQHRVKEQQ
ncbi:o-succinylbenzoate--CoA ligase [Rodentibacter trehalosifermentans]|uniref:O-succinylbenzoate--CoA ligase n=1 Tax=Rodentibacter trehalosifermentans TaxID=1908263 RepID=A0A1V3J2E4_9PAST|nr:o-succinylbenzoate--CoA ligase [Rodentibacter trehalosifermentans]OOF44251.1 o-succinylbenzoate--CoA ligase [Rodentibacter trehalosifermentans]OOF49222.1 o-succinylbenzoate--CoA ligase [Rodentibacter trehalosifermentans]